MNSKFIILVLIFIIKIISFNSSAFANDVDKNNKIDFKIVNHNDKGFLKASKKVVVFGIPIYAYKQVEDSKLLHAANIMAQYLDNDEDGNVDNQKLLDALILNNAKLYLWKYPNQRNLDAQDLGADETIPNWHKNNHIGRFDASLEEIWHVITSIGYKNAYPEIFGEKPGTKLANAMDIARGGKFIRIPFKYPKNAWYTYKDRTCDYACMITEYFYWAMTSILGGQEKRLDEIEDEWKLNTKQLVKTKDKLIYKLLTDPQYKLPTVLPDGSYRN